MKNTFLFELGTEEVPAGMIPPALDQLRSAFQQLLSESRLESSGPISVFSSPRRLAVCLQGLADRQPDRTEQVTGPPVSVGLDAQGKPTQAAAGFARKAGIEVDQLQQVETDKGTYLGFQKTIPGQTGPAVFKQALPALIASLSWPKNMYWRASKFRFIRPLRWFVALWNGEVVEFEFEAVTSGRVTRGHRFLGSQSIVLKDASDYLEPLRDNFVLAEADERRSKIETEIVEMTPPGLQVVPDPSLLDEVVFLNEYPRVICGSFDSSFLEMPKEILITVMRHHQKYFSVLSSEGVLQPFFLTVINNRQDREGLIRRGHEKVLRARLEDAAFFWKTDQNRTLADRLSALNDILFQETLGTYAEKTERLAALCEKLSSDPELLQAARLCKADLTTEMVREFPELQGVMGGLYARREEIYPESVCTAIYEHYRPGSLEDECPSTSNGALLSVADKLDTVAGCFSIGIVPTGSSDPFALRRQAQGLIKVLLDCRLELSVADLVRQAQEAFQQPAAEAQETFLQVMDFLTRRTRFIFQGRELEADVVRAVTSGTLGIVHVAFDKARALAEIRREADFEAIATAYKRIKNILLRQSIEREQFDESLLAEPGEIELYKAFRQVEDHVSSALEMENYTEALAAIASLRGPVDRFFDEVLVMAEDINLRRNRLSLLAFISDLFLKLADISEIAPQE